jgi:hypothetical protein
MRPNIPSGGPVSGAPHGAVADVPTVQLGAPPAAPVTSAEAAAPRPALPEKVVCPVCTTTFAPHGTRGRCPVCGEQVVPVEEATRTLPIISPVASWLFQEGNWRLVAVGVLVLYQLIIFIALWIHLAQIHAF